MSEKKNITKPMIASAIVECGGVMSLIAAKLQCSRKNVYDRINGDEDLKATLKDTIERTGDAAENVIINALTMGVVYRKKIKTTGKGAKKKTVEKIVEVELMAKDQVKTAQWYVERKCKARGYSTRVEVTGSDDKPLIPNTPDLSKLSKKELEQLHKLHDKIKE